MMASDSSAENGELAFYHSIEDSIQTIFDVGCRADSEFLDFHGEVHYFDPVPDFIKNLSSQPTNNRKAIFNTFGLGIEESTQYYYPKYQSFHNRIVSCGKDDASNRVLFEIKRGDEYMKKTNLQTVDFLKIDTEGHELEVLKGFGDRLKDVKIVQFEYGGTYLDSKIHLQDVIDHLYLHGFERFGKLTRSGIAAPLPLTQNQDDYQYANIVCFRD
jgi:FkbM family methyltransferase